jgi:hypothetical protein
MYSGSTLHQLRDLDRWFGAHQKIDRLAWRHLQATVTPETLRYFPRVRQILTFEGSNGPDAIKRKTPAQDEPWHYYDPYDAGDTKLLDIIAAHYDELVAAIRSGNETRACFEAAWLAHAVVDGLTPAHHYPYEQELKRLRNGLGIETRRTPKEKLMMPGDTVREKMHNNWSMWGDKGLLATHIAFEAGVALLILPMRYRTLDLSPHLPVITGRKPYLLFFKSQAKKIADGRYYEQFYRHGWLPKLGKQVRRDLIPDIVLTVAFIWHSALAEARRSKR